MQYLTNDVKVIELEIGDMERPVHVPVAGRVVSVHLVLDDYQGLTVRGRADHVTSLLRLLHLRLSVLWR